MRLEVVFIVHVEFVFISDFQSIYSSKAGVEMVIDYLVSNTLLACECNCRAKELVGGLVKGSKGSSI